MQPTGSRLWRLAYRFGGKQKLLALGTYPIVSLKDARQEREEAKRLLFAGIDPSQQRKEEAQRLGDTFRVVADEYIAKLAKEGRAERTLKKVSWMLSFTYPDLGEQKIKDIDAPAILDVLRGVEARGRHETARRLRSTIGSVFRYAIATARADADPTIALKGALVNHKVNSYAAIIDPKKLGGLLRAIDGFEGQPSTHAALKIMPILFPRPGELRAAEWSEFDFETAVWKVPPVA